VLHCTN